MVLESNIFLLLKILEGNPNLQDREAIFVPQISYQGVCYGVFGSKNFRDSAIIFGDERTMGVIQRFSNTTRGWYLLVHQHRNFTRADFVDPYLPYGSAAGFLCEGRSGHRSPHQALDIISHCAITPIPEGECIHIMPLDRVSVRVFVYIFLAQINLNQLMLSYGQ